MRRFEKFAPPVALGVLLTLGLGCGHHSGEARTYVRPGEVRRGESPKTAAEKMERAIGADDAAEVERLVKQGEIGVEGPLANGRTPLNHAVRNAKNRIVHFLVKMGAKPDVVDGNDGMTAKAYAEVKDLGRIRALLDFELRDRHRAELLGYIRDGSPHMIENFLRESGVDPNFLDAEGDTPLTLAVRLSVNESQIDLIQALVQWKDPELDGLTATDVNMRNAAGKTAFALARELNLSEISEVLLAAGGRQ
jgi:hypothetical protein